MVSNPKVLSVNNIASAKQGIEVFPNPSSGVFVVKSEELRTKSSIEVFNMIGEKVYDGILPQTLSASQAGPKGALKQIDLSNQPNGVYLLKVVGEDGSYQVQKIEVAR